MRKLILFLLILPVMQCSDDTVSKQAEITSLTITPSELILSIGDTHTLSTAILPAEADDAALTWTSSNTAVATVNESGRITALTAGTTTITASSTNGLHESECSVTVLTENQFVFNNDIWNMFNRDVFSIQENSETLQLDLEENALWYNASEGGQVYQLISGDFVLTATVRSVKRTNNTQPTECNVCLGGLMVRNPASSTADQDYVHIVTGVTPGGYGAEIKSTTNSNSIYQPTDQNQLPFTDGRTSHQLRIEREGSNFTLFKKSLTDIDWIELETYNRPDLPAELAVGFNIYTSVNGASVADLSVIYQNVMITQ